MKIIDLCLVVCMFCICVGEEKVMVLVFSGLVIVIMLLF